MISVEDPVEVIRHTWIPLSDGTRLSARIWLPAGLQDERVPAVLEYIPYRKNDWYARSDSMIHPYFAAHGYAAIRVDIRGSGDSDGLLCDEYLAQEQADAVEVISWIAEQSWCSGRVGMMGFSWGGFAALQVAALRPPNLAAIIPCYFTDNRYTDDAHYLGGCVLASEMLSWSTTMLAYTALPPDPETVMEAWEETWRERLQAVEPPVHKWLSHQVYDDYWRHGSVCEDYSAIACPVYAIGGFADGYSDPVPRLLEGLAGPKKGLLGPWAHYYPFGIDPGPRIGFLQECLRWWDQWLKDEDTGIMEEPMLRIWMPDLPASDPSRQEWAGRWIGRSSWPPADVSNRRLWLGDGTLGETAKSETALSIVGSQAAGHESGLWCPLGTPFDLPPDQRREDGLSLCFTSEPLPSTIELLGHPRASLALSSDTPDALVVARLCDIAPTGASTVISRGVLNLTHRESHSNPAALEAGRVYDVVIPLKVTAYTVRAGHRIRLSVSPTYWPWTWPSPKPVALHVVTGRSQLELPVYVGQAKEAPLTPFAEPDFSEPVPAEVIATYPNLWHHSHDVATGQHELEIRLAPLSGDGGAGRIRLLDSELEIEEQQEDHYAITEPDPLSARIECKRSCQLHRGDWDVKLQVRATMSSDADAFYVTHLLQASSHDVTVASRAWDMRIPRALL